MKYYFLRTVALNSNVSFLYQFSVFIKGIILGLFAFIPGIGPISVSYILNIHKQYLDLIENFVSLIKNLFLLPFKKSSIKKINNILNKLITDFSLPLFFGTFLGITLFTFVFSFLLFNMPAYIRSLFFGLTLASSLYILKLIKIFNSKRKLLYITSFIVCYLLLGFTSNNIFFTPNVFLIFISGLLTPLSLIIPGIGVSFFVIILNTYHYILDTLYAIFYGTPITSDYITIYTFMFSVLLGLFLVYYFFKKIFKKYLDLYLVISSSIMLASLRLLYPYIRVKGDILYYVKPFDLPLGHMTLLSLVTIFSFLITRFLMSYLYSDNKH